MSRRDPRSDVAEDLNSIIARVLANVTLIDDVPAEPEKLVRRRMLEGAEFPFPKRALDAAECADETLEAITEVRRFTEPGVLVLAGEKGSGKTVAATWWALQRATPSRLITAHAFACQSRYSEQRRDLVNGFRALVLDDLGAEYADDKGAFVSDLDELINVAYSDKRRLIITTNSDGKTFATRYGDRIIDRIAECGQWVTLQSRSMRGPTP